MKTMQAVLRELDKFHTLLGLFSRQEEGPSVKQQAIKCAEVGISRI